MSNRSGYKVVSARSLSIHGGKPRVRYDVGPTVRLPDGQQPVACQVGFHYCPVARDCLRYVGWQRRHRLLRVSVPDDATVVTDDGCKCAASALTVVEDVTHDAAALLGIPTPLDEPPLVGYKIIRDDWTYAGTTYRVGETIRLPDDVDPEPSEKAFRFCLTALDCLRADRWGPESRLLRVVAQGDTTCVTTYDSVFYTASALFVEADVTADAAALLTGVVVSGYPDRHWRVFRNGEPPSSGVMESTSVVWLNVRSKRYADGTMLSLRRGIVVVEDPAGETEEIHPTDARWAALAARIQAAEPYERFDTTTATADVC
jgi:hypothetical protein